MRMRIKDFTTKVGSGVTPKGGATAYQDHGIPLFRSQNITNEGLLTDDIAYISEDIHNSMSGSKLRPNDVLLNITGASIGRCYYLPEDFTEGNVNQHVCIIRLKKNVLPAFLYYNLISATGQRLIDRCQTGANREGLTKEDLCNFEFEIPSIERQKGIVKYLNEKNSLITNQVSLLTSKRDAYLRLKKSIINRAVTKGLNPDVQMKDSGIEWIGEVPEGWEACRFKDFITLKTNSSFSDAKIGLENIEGKNGRFVKTDTEFEGNGIAFKKDDIVYGKLRPYLQKVWIAEFEGNAVGDFYVFSVKGNAVPTYIKYLFLSDGFTYEVNSSTVGAKMPRVSSNFILTMCYCLPTKTEQHSISTYLDDKCSKIDRIISNLDKQISKYGELKRSLIDEVITGKRDCIAIR